MNQYNAYSFKPIRQYNTYSFIQATNTHNEYIQQARTTSLYNKYTQRAYTPNTPKEYMLLWACNEKIRLDAVKQWKNTRWYRHEMYTLYGLFAYTCCVCSLLVLVTCVHCMYLLRVFVASTCCVCSYVCSLHLLVACVRYVSHVASCLSRGVLFKPLSHCSLHVLVACTRCVCLLRVFVCNERIRVVVRMH